MSLSSFHAFASLDIPVQFYPNR